MFAQEKIMLSSKRPSSRQTDRQAGRQADRQTDRQAGRQAGRQADRQTDRRTEGRTGRHRCGAMHFVRVIACTQIHGHKYMYTVDYNTVSVSLSLARSHAIMIF